MTSSVHFVDANILRCSFESTRDLADDHSNDDDYRQLRSRKRQKQREKNANAELEVEDSVSESSLSVISACESSSDIQRLQTSYINAHQSDALKSNRMSILFRSVNDSWDSYSLIDRMNIIKELLDALTIENIQKQLEKIVCNVSKSKDWDDEMKKKQLTSENLRWIIEIDVKYTWKRESQSSLCHSLMKSMISKYHEHAKYLQRQTSVYRYAKWIATFIEHSLMQIQKFVNDSIRKTSIRVRMFCQILKQIKADADRSTSSWRRLRARVTTGKNDHEHSLHSVIRCLRRLSEISEKWHCFYS